MTPVEVLDRPQASTSLEPCAFDPHASDLRATGRSRSRSGARRCSWRRAHRLRRWRHRRARRHRLNSRPGRPSPSDTATTRLPASSAPEHFDGKAPVAVYVHGGSWIDGDHDTGGFIIDQIGPALTKDGFVVANVNYRLGPDHYWPAQIEDVMCAVRYLRAHAASLQIDPDRIGAWGHSAGGHLVAMLGTAASEARWDKGPYESESSAVEAVVDLSGPSNLATMSTEGASGYVRDTFVGLLGPVPADELPQALLEASPVHYVSGGDPPFLIIHGNEDTIVYPQQSEELYAALRAAGVRATLVIVTGGAHELNEPGAEPEPDAITQMVVDFFSSHLDRAGGAG